MTVRKLYIGSEGPFLYDDAEQRPDGTGLQGLVCEGAPIGSNDVLRLDDLGGGGPGAPSGASYVVMSLDGDLSAERRLQVGNSLSLTDSGANADVTLDAIQDIRTSASPMFAGLGIGTPTPQRTVHIESLFACLRISDSNAANDQEVNALIEFYRGNNTNRVGYLAMDSSANDIMALATEYAAGILQFRTGSGVAAMTIDASQNAGIGTATIDANYKLIVRRATDINFGIGLQGSELALTAFNDAISANVPMRFYASEFNFINGNVGIKVIDPDQVLEVNGVVKIAPSGNAQSVLLLDADYASGTLASRIDFLQKGVHKWTIINDRAQDGTNDLRFYEGNVNTLVMAMLSGGNVGIKTDAPNQTLCFANESTLGDISYSSGWTGTDWAVTYVSGLSTFELDDLWVRGTLRVYELIINQINAVNGGMVISAANGKVETVVMPTVDAEVVDMDDPEGNNYTTFAVNDIIMIQRVDLDAAPGTIVKRLLRRVAAISGRRVWFVRDGDLPASTGAVAIGDTVVVIGNTTDTTRDSLIYLTSQDINNPFIQIMDGIGSWADWTDSDKVRGVFGNMKGKYNYASEIYGIGIGVESDIHMTMDPTNGLRIIDGANADDILLQANSATLTIGDYFVYTAADTTLKVAGWTVSSVFITKTFDTDKLIRLNTTAGNEAMYFYDPTPTTGDVRWVGFGALFNGSSWTAETGIGMVQYNGAGYDKLFWLSDVSNSIAGWTISASTLQKLTANVGVSLDAATPKIQVGDLDEQHLDLLGSDGTIKWYKSDDAGGSTLVLTIDDALYLGDPGLRFEGDGVMYMYTDANKYTVIGHDRILMTISGIATVNLTRSAGDLQLRTTGNKNAQLNSTTLRVEDLGTDASPGTDVQWYAGGYLYRYTSSCRYKTDIIPLEVETDRIYGLEVRSYTTKKTNERTFGLIAEEVYEVTPEIVNLDDKNRPDSIRSPLLSYMMLEELKKLRKDVNELIVAKELK